MESLYHAGFENESKVEIHWVDSENLLDQERCAEELSGVDGIILPGGFGDRGIEGMIQAARYAREQNIPYFGICLGMQIMVMEYARDVLGLSLIHIYIIELLQTSTLPSQHDLKAAPHNSRLTA